MDPVDFASLVQASIEGVPHTPLKRRRGRSVKAPAEKVFPRLLRWLVANGRQVRLDFKSGSGLEHIKKIFPDRHPKAVERDIIDLAKHADSSVPDARSSDSRPFRHMDQARIDLYCLYGRLGALSVRTELAIDRVKQRNYTVTLRAVLFQEDYREGWKSVPLPALSVSSETSPSSMPTPALPPPDAPRSPLFIEPLDGTPGPSESLPSPRLAPTSPGSALRLRQCRLTELLHGTTFARVHLFVVLEAVAQVASYPHTAEVDESSPHVSILLTDWKLRIHDLPAGTAARLHLLQNMASKYRLRVDFCPPLSPGQRAAFTLRLLRHQHRAMTLPEVRARMSAGTYNISSPLVPAADAAIASPVDSFVATTIFPRGYRVRSPHVDVQHHQSRLGFLPEAQRLRDNKSLTVTSRRGRTILQLSVMAPLERFAYFVYYEPPESFPQQVPQ